MNELVDYLIFRDWILPITLALVILVIWLIVNFIIWLAEKLKDRFKNK